jgi:hypothetical protein
LCDRQREFRSDDAAGVQQDWLHDGPNQSSPRSFNADFRGG